MAYPKEDYTPLASYNRVRPYAYNSHMPYLVREDAMLNAAYDICHRHRLTVAEYYRRALSPHLLCL
jgi:hypothetical protein